MEILLDTLKDVAIDTAKLVPFLFVTYLIMEYVERKTADHSAAFLQRTGKAAPLIGAAAGIVPQCGFSAAAASLYSGGLISVGALMAAFLATSDEMVPIFISSAVHPGTILKILLFKFVYAAVAGLVIDFVGKRIILKFRREKHIHDLCEREHDHHDGILKSALIHTLHITIFIAIVSLGIGLLINYVGQETISAFLARSSILGILLAALIGLIPNCAASVMLAELYLQHILTAGQMISGLLVGAGVGILVLCRTNRNVRENILILTCLYAAGVVGGLIIEATGLQF